MGMIGEAIAKSGARFGLETRTNAEVSRILVRDGRAEGVVLAKGDEIRAKTIISNASARHTFLNLVDESALPDEFLRDIRNFKGQSTAFKIHLAVDELPHYPGLGAAGLGNQYPVQVCVAPSIEGTRLAPSILDRAGADCGRSRTRACGQTHSQHLWRACAFGRWCRSWRGDA
jgi:phytoene dehydrogenase-like protein